MAAQISSEACYAFCPNLISFEISLVNTVGSLLGFWAVFKDNAISCQCNDNKISIDILVENYNDIHNSHHSGYDAGQKDYHKK